MSKPNRNYEPEFKQKVVCLVLEEGRTIKSVNEEYSLGEGTVRSWIRKFEEECKINRKPTIQKIFMKRILNFAGNWLKLRRKMLS